MFGWPKSKSRKYKTPRFSLALGHFSRECLDATYQEGVRTIVFDGERVGKKWEQLNLRVPADLGEEALHRVLANLAEALEKMGHEFLVFRTGPAEPIPEDQQKAAIAGIRQMGMEPEVSANGSTITLKKLPGWKPPAEFDAKQQAIHMTRLLSTARGKKARIEILAKSKSAVVDFI